MVGVVGLPVVDKAVLVRKIERGGVNVAEQKSLRSVRVLG